MLLVRLLVNSRRLAKFLKSPKLYVNFCLRGRRAVCSASPTSFKGQLRLVLKSIFLCLCSFLRIARGFITSKDMMITLLKVLVHATELFQKARGASSSSLSISTSHRTPLKITLRSDIHGTIFIS